MKTDLAHRSNYGSSRSLSKIKYIVIHYTANDGDTDENNGNYFNGANRKASAHYFVDDDSVTQSVPDNYVAWHCGGGLQGSSGHTFYQKCTNTNSIGIEICDDVKNGKVYPSAKTIENAIELTKTLMKKYNVPASNVIRHYDVTGKSCPAYWCGSDVKNKKWKTEFWNKLSSNTNTSSSNSTSNSKPNTTTTSTKLTVDGSFGKATVIASQKYFGTSQDGKISNQPSSNKKYLEAAVEGVWEFKSSGYSAGSSLIKAMQKKFGATADGFFGKGSVTSMLIWLNNKGYDCGTAAGYMGVKTVKAWQSFLNDNLK